MANAPKSFFLTNELATYIVEHSGGLQPLEQRLIDETRQVAGELAIMQVSPEQGALLTLLCRLIGARQAIELGTFTGYSTWSIARGLVDGGRVATCDISADWPTIGRRYWQAADVADRIDVHVLSARDFLSRLPREPYLDFAFMDADKAHYPEHYEAILPRLRPGGLLVVDNVLWSGKVLDSAIRDDCTLGISALNDKIAVDRRVDKVMLAVSDGITLVRKR